MMENLMMGIALGCQLMALRRRFERLAVQQKVSHSIHRFRRNAGHCRSGYIVGTLGTLLLPSAHARPRSTSGREGVCHGR